MSLKLASTTYREVVHKFADGNESIQVVRELLKPYKGKAERKAIKRDLMRPLKRQRLTQSFR